MAGDERWTCTSEEGWWRWARGVSGSVAWVVVGRATKGELEARGCVGCVMYVPGSSSGLYERTRGGEDEMMGSSRFIVWSGYTERMDVEARAGRGAVGAPACVAAVNKTTRASGWQTKARWCVQRLGHRGGFYVVWSRGAVKEEQGDHEKVTDALSRWRLGPLHYVTALGLE